MHTILLYVVKMTICAGILMGYYWYFLRNKRFHQYNRFYLISSTAFSLLIPLIHLSWFTFREDDFAEDSVIKVFYSQNIDSVVIADKGLSVSAILEWSILGISAGLIGLLIYRIVQILRLRKKYPSTQWKDIEFLETNIQNAPFSFMKYLFWKDTIDLHSPTGQQILEHELAHIRQKHSLDKIFMQIVTSIVWMNPFFWLIKRELDILHEFLADECAIKNNDTKAFAQMLLASKFEGRLLDPVHPFAYKPIKRRLQMLTSSKKPSYSYLRRLLFLPLLFAVTGLLAITIKKQDWEKPKIALVDWAKAVGIDLNHDTPSSVSKSKLLPDTLVIIRDNKKRDTIANVSPEKLKLVVSHLKKQDSVMLHFIPDTSRVIVRGTHNWSNGGKPMMFVDGKESEGDFNQLNPNEIQSVSILKGVKAQEKYGANAINGVILIETKKHENKEKLNEVVVVGYAKPRIYEKNKPVDEEPHFKGGVNAWRMFLERNLRANVPSENGAKTNKDYTVIVSFTVDKDGKLSDFQSDNDPGYGTAQEVIRLMKTSPDWDPATISGKPVVYRQRQQVTFKVSEE